MTEQTQPTKLKACPFCGSKDLKTERCGTDDECCFVQCKSCEAGGPTSVPRSVPNSCEKWNTRATDPRIAELEKELKAAIDSESYFEKELARSESARIGAVAELSTLRAEKKELEFRAIKLATLIAAGVGHGYKVHELVEEMCAAIAKEKGEGK